MMNIQVKLKTMPRRELHGGEALADMLKVHRNLPILTELRYRYEAYPDFSTALAGQRFAGEMLQLEEVDVLADLLLVVLTAQGGEEIDGSMVIYLQLEDKEPICNFCAGIRKEGLPRVREKSGECDARLHGKALEAMRAIASQNMTGKILYEARAAKGVTLETDVGRFLIMTDFEVEQPQDWQMERLAVLAKGLACLRGDDAQLQQSYAKVETALKVGTHTSAVYHASIAESLFKQRTSPILNAWKVWQSFNS